MLRAEEKTTLRSPSSVAQGETYVHGGDFHFVASGVELEGSHDTGVDAQYPWETYPHRKHDHTMYVGAMIVDKHPVTNQQYSEYLEKSKYHPSDDGNWLKHSFEDGKIKAGWADKPVTYVSMADARAYCSFQKKRLPHACAFPHIPQPLSNPSLSLVDRSDGSVVADEWQYFAGNSDGRLYPWGNDWDESRMPKLSNNWTNPGPEPVGSHPSGASPFGVQDLVRSVWQMTSEFEDIHNRFVILRGGSNYNPYRGASKATPQQNNPWCLTRSRVGRQGVPLD